MQVLRARAQILDKLTALPVHELPPIQILRRLVHLQRKLRYSSWSKQRNLSPPRRRLILTRWSRVTAAIVTCNSYYVLFRCYVILTALSQSKRCYRLELQLPVDHEFPGHRDRLVPPRVSKYFLASLTRRWCILGPAVFAVFTGVQDQLECSRNNEVTRSTWHHEGFCAVAEISVRHFLYLYLLLFSYILAMTSPKQHELWPNVGPRI